MPADLTIEQLAAESGMSVRNIRAYQSRGLLEPPEVRLRVGYYGPEHVAQLRLIRDLQADGFNLAGIKRLLDDTQGTAQRLEHFRQALTEPTNAERPQILTVTGSAAGSGSTLSRHLGCWSARSVLVRVDHDRYELPRSVDRPVASASHRGPAGDLRPAHERADRKRVRRADAAALGRA